MKSLLILCDGMGDRLTHGTTPLETARKPNMDKLSAEGINGVMDTVRAGIRPGSDTSHLSLFGYDPYKAYAGRGPFEAAGVGLEVEEGDVAIRCNFATVQDEKITDRRAGRYEYGLGELAEEIKNITINGVEIIFKRCAGHRGVIILRGKGKELSAMISDTDPESLGVPVPESKSLDNSKSSLKTAEILNEFTRITMGILKNHPVNKERISRGKLPANVILCRGVGTTPNVLDFEKKYGIKAACISATSLISGVCRTVGMDIIEVEGATGHTDSDIGAKATAAIRALNELNYDFVFLHIKGTDEASHDGDFNSKKKMIERIDTEVIAPILKNVKDTTIVLTADHSTPVALKQHSADPVPIVITGDVRTDLVIEFGERTCARGDLNRICGRDLMNIILDLSDRAKLFGA